MSIALIDLHIKFVVDFAIRQVMKDPDRILPQILGDAKLEPHARLYGDKMISEAKNWLMSTKIPVVLGYTLDPTQIPCVAISLDSAVPDQQYLGDTGFLYSEPQDPIEKLVIVPKFAPELVELSEDKTTARFVPPLSLTQEQRDIMMLGRLNVRDNRGLEYSLGFNGIDFVLGPISNSVVSGDFSSLEVIANSAENTYRQGAMLYDQRVLLAVLGHADRIEGIWLWAIVQWALLKYRPLMASVFGLDLALSTSSQFSKDDSFLGENVWTRYITLSAKSMYTWEAYKTQDVYAFLVSVKASMGDLLL